MTALTIYIPTHYHGPMTADQIKLLLCVFIFANMIWFVVHVIRFIQRGFSFERWNQYFANKDNDEMLKFFNAMMVMCWIGVLLIAGGWLTYKIVF